MKVAVVTPTIGTGELFQCMESVQKQTYDNLTHYIFLDGEEHYEKIYPVLRDVADKKTIKTVSLDDNVGKNWLGHRVYASCSFLVNADVIIYLDEDNWLDDCHVEKMIRKIEDGADWAYSLRKIYSKDGEYICDDNCESLGKWPIYFNDNAFLIDTSAFAIKQSIAVQVGHAWYDTKNPKAADRQFYHVLKTYFPNYECTGEYTLNYRLGGNPNSVSREFFEEGNRITFSKYGDSMPWRMPSSKKLMTVGPGISIVE